MGCGIDCAEVSPNLCCVPQHLRRLLQTLLSSAPATSRQSQMWIIITPAGRPTGRGRVGSATIDQPPDDAPSTN